MGMFDSFYLKNIKCPHCDEITDEMEFQTKQFDCGLNVWREGQEFTAMEILKGTIKNVYGGCCKSKCKEFVTKENGYWGGFGRTIYCDVEPADQFIQADIL